MANFFPKKLLELDSFLKVRDPFTQLSQFFWGGKGGPDLSVKWDKSCVGSILFGSVKHSHILPFT